MIGFWWSISLLLQSFLATILAILKNDIDRQHEQTRIKTVKQ